MERETSWVGGRGEQNRSTVLRERSLVSGVPQPPLLSERGAGRDVLDPHGTVVAVHLNALDRKFACAVGIEQTCCAVCLRCKVGLFIVVLPESDSYSVL